MVAGRTALCPEAPRLVSRQGVLLLFAGADRVASDERDEISDYALGAGAPGELQPELQRERLADFDSRSAHRNDFPGERHSGKPIQRHRAGDPELLSAA